MLSPAELVKYWKSKSSGVVITRAKTEGAKFHQYKPSEVVVESCRWIILDQHDFPRLFYAYFPSKHAAALMYLVEHKVRP